MISSFAGVLGLSDDGVRILMVAAGVLAGAALFRWAAGRRRPDAETERAWRSIGTWWGLFLVLVVVLASGRIGVLVVTALVSLLLLSETLRLVEGPSLFPGLAAGAVLLYGWAWLDWITVFTVALPVAVALLAAWEGAVRVAPGSIAFARRPTFHYPILMALIGPAYVFGVASLPAPRSMPESGMGWFLLLVILTELNDMAQAWWGRALGSRPLAPTISPGKTWEGLLGGLTTTAVVAVAVGPALTGWGRSEPPGLQLGAPAWVWSLGLGVVMAVAGITGDLAASALKRSAGVKDAGRLLPGQGGVLDRFDSMMVTAPVYFLLTWALWVPTP